MTIPRLELNAAVISAKMSKFLKDELNHLLLQEYFWVDNKVALNYIRNAAKRFYVYVANRLQQIHDLSNPDCWLYVESRSYPSDVASRGLSAENLIKSEWLRGPSYLWETHETWNNAFDVIDKQSEALVKNDLRKVNCLEYQCFKHYVHFFEDI